MLSLQETSLPNMQRYRTGVVFAGLIDHDGHRLSSPSSPSSVLFVLGSHRFQKHLLGTFGSTSPPPLTLASAMSTGQRRQRGASTAAAGIQGKRQKGDQQEGQDEEIQHQRECEAALVDVVLLPSSTLPVTKAKEHTKKWAELVKKDGKGHNHGPPHLHAWEGLHVGLLDPSSDIGQANRGSLQKLEAGGEHLGLPQVGHRWASAAGRHQQARQGSPGEPRAVVVGSHGAVQVSPGLAESEQLGDSTEEEAARHLHGDV